jgi:hypothetical protein
MHEFNKFMFLAPPRAEKAIMPSMLPFYQKPNWIAQAKKNGTNSVIYVSPDKEVFAYNRHGERHKAWEFTEATSKIFKNLPGEGWYAINAELLHNKVKGIRNINYIHDILVCDGQYLGGTTYAHRYCLLQTLFFHEHMKSTPTHWILDKHTWLARNFRDNFSGVFASLTTDVDEGIVLKNMEGILQPARNNGWTVKCRKPTKNFSF